MDKIYHSFDVKNWVNEFREIAKEKFNHEIDDEWIDLFTTAIMFGYEKQQPKLDKLLDACRKAFNLVEDEFNNKIIVEMDGSFGLLHDLREAISFSELQK
jgi:hypothetical protein